MHSGLLNARNNYINRIEPLSSNSTTLNNRNIRYTTDPHNFPSTSFDVTHSVSAVPFLSGVLSSPLTSSIMSSPEGL